MGQNFLIDPQITDEIVSYGTPLQGREIIEIGPGLGMLTQSLLNSPATKVTAIEKDPRAAHHLNEILGYPQKLRVLEGDGLKINPCALTQTPPKIIANLPYNVATPLLIHWLRYARDIEQFILMFQWEVGARICAAPSQKAYGRLSVISQICGKCENVMTIAPEYFYPQPKIFSVIVRITPYERQPSPEQFAIIERLTQAAFGQRRKMLRSTFKNFCDGKLLALAGIDGTRRGETLTIEEFLTLANIVADEERMTISP